MFVLPVPVDPRPIGGATASPAPINGYDTYTGVITTPSKDKTPTIVDTTPSTSPPETKPSKRNQGNKGRSGAATEHHTVPGDDMKTLPHLPSPPAKDKCKYCSESMEVFKIDAWSVYQSIISAQLQKWHMTTSHDQNVKFCHFSKVVVMFLFLNNYNTAYWKRNE